MIVIGYQGIGKSTICKDNLRYIDFESSALKVFGRRMIGWELPYCQMATWLSKQGYVVFTSSHKEVRKYLTGTDEYCIAIVPALELKKEWVEKLKARYHESDLEKDRKAYLNAKIRYKENIREIMDDVADTYVIDDMDYDLKQIVAEYETIKDVPSADVVKVVRCKDCKWCKQLHSKYHSTQYVCEAHEDTEMGFAIDPNGYCSYGEEQEHE